MKEEIEETDVRKITTIIQEQLWQKVKYKPNLKLKEFILVLSVYFRYNNLTLFPFLVTNLVFRLMKS